jgi:hypothetical protein
MQTRHHKNNKSTTGHLACISNIHLLICRRLTKDLTGPNDEGSPGPVTSAGMASFDVMEAALEAQNAWRPKGLARMVLRQRDEDSKTGYVRSLESLWGLVFQRIQGSEIMWSHS